jgi:hypothetical protein
MRALLGAHPGAAEIYAPSPFQMLVFGGFAEVDGCVFFREFFHEDRIDWGVVKTRYTDRTGFECTMNKIHLEQYLEKGMAREDPSLALTAVKCAEFLARHLGKKIPAAAFRIIASVKDRVCPLRFHKVREGEAWFKDIDGFEEALFVMDVAPARGPLAKPRSAAADRPTERH